MQQHEERSACGNPTFERSLLSQEHLCRWKGLPIAWIAAAPHTVCADLVAERNGLVMLDAGATQADFVYGARSMAREFTTASIGYFAAGTELKSSCWRWATARRIYVDLDTKIAVAHELEFARELPDQSELEFRDPELTSVLRMMAAEVASGSPNGQLFAESLSLGVLMRLCSRASSRRAANFERGKLAAAHARRVQEFVESQLDKDLTLASLAGLTGFSPAQFVRLFKRTFMCTPHQYVLRRRLDYARELAISTDLPLAVIASLAGFSSQSHMTSAFVRTYKAPPGQMRRTAKLARSN